MAGIIEELMDTLEQQNAIYEQLLEIGAKKKVTIVENKLDELSAFLSQENTLIGRVNRLDKKREENFKDIAMVLNKNFNDLTVTKILVYIKGQPEEERLRKVRDSILQNTEKLKQINDLNKMLIESSLEHIEFSMNVLRSSLNGRPTYYDSAGNEITSSNRMLFDTKQ